MAFLALMILFFAVVRFGCFHRTRRAYRSSMYGWHPSRQLHHLSYAGQTRQPVPQARESAFERLKRKYVKGEISDYQYEAELDELLKTPEGRRDI